MARDVSLKTSKNFNANFLRPFFEGVIVGMVLLVVREIHLDQLSPLIVNFEPIGLIFLFEPERPN